jgi:stage III sporulation protein AA
MDNSDYIYDISKYFKSNHALVLESIQTKDLNEIEEIRIRANEPVVIHKQSKGYFLSKTGKLLNSMENCLVLSFKDIDDLISAFCKHSIFAYDAEIKRGFITIEGGYRIGISGRGVFKEDKMHSLRDFCGINIRIPRELVGISKMLLPYIFYNGVFLNTLIVSPPNQGKTTLLRDIARCLGDADGCDRHKTVIIDERSEIAGIGKGTSMYKVGAWTDVLDGIEKSRAIFMALRSLSPQIIVTDEIGLKKDLNAVYELANSGVDLIASTHAYSSENLRNKLFFKKLIDERIIRRFVFLNSLLGKGTVSGIYDESLKPIISRPFLLKR